MKIAKKIIKNILPYFLVKNYQEHKYKLKEYILCKKMRNLDRERKEFVFKDDYIRDSSLELIANEIYDKNILGAVAELGVFIGDFAKLINVAFPDRKLYLFDTFEGFDERDIKTELKHNFSSASGRNDFSETSVELVLAKMKNRDNCIIKKGYFPETAAGVNDIFSFVSIDVDLYKPIYKGLYYFYDKLNSGGYIMIHDYNNTQYNGAKAALRKFSEEKKVPYFPICDPYGSAVIVKP